MSCNKEETERLYQLAVGCWGESAQLLKTIEELSELSKAISRYLIMIGGENIPKNAQHYNEDLQLIEMYHEIVDVEIMIGQLKSNFKRDAVYQHAREVKLHRLKRLLELEGAEFS